MSKGKALVTLISGLFPKSEKSISEKLSTEEHNAFMEDAQELSARLESQEGGNEQVVADLATANTKVAELTTQLATMTTLSESRATELTAVTAERDTYKAHYDAAKAAGTLKAGEDENSRQQPQVSSYNANAMEVFNRTHGGPSHGVK